mmetsp:Transcript_16578/g.35008  ORF Transcript_16578/g.35008 Transcript_16578/m.35008 type:complete len:263 (+) Transcript_16578:98-886(+)|eukprot:CAMPEP_0180437094 /NCGR_PEP_ID=MMETSP1036_2-20121128/11361_1 /TAXON_ID=632150 /ORGANISM="Azadinium spinosum, Strain 3D9" /LENGTH=262 /DNA_ID=CAMNT_0022443123 /DNA_START=32 /DNA_END=820 /DNA_ORIENTATION=+
MFMEAIAEGPSELSSPRSPRSPDKAANPFMEAVRAGVRLLSSEEGKAEDSVSEQKSDNGGYGAFFDITHGPDEESCGATGFCLDDPPLEFLVTLVKDEALDDIAIDIDSSDGLTLLVMQVRPGLVQLWNKTHWDLHQDVRVYDRIVEVNGVRGDAADLLRAMRSDRTVDLMVKRPVEYRIEVTKEASPFASLGVIVDDRDGRTLRVEHVLEGGLLDQWNKTHWQVPVRTNDRIVAVNGVCGDSGQLLERVRLEGTLEVVLEH